MMPFVNTSVLARSRKWAKAILSPVVLLALAGCAVDESGDVRTLAAPGLASADLSRVVIVAVDSTDQQRYRSAITKEGTLDEAEKRCALALTAKGYTVVSGDAERMAKARIDLSNSLDNAGVVQLGRAVSVPAVLLVRITQYSRADQPAPTPTTPSAPSAYAPGSGTAQNRVPEGLASRKQYQVTAAVTARLISVPAGEVLWTGWQSRSADRLDGDDDGGVLNHTCDDIVQAMPLRPTPQRATTSPASPQ